MSEKERAPCEAFIEGKQVGAALMGLLACRNETLTLEGGLHRRGGRSLCRRFSLKSSSPRCSRKSLVWEANFEGVAAHVASRGLYVAVQSNLVGPRCLYMDLDLPPTMQHRSLRRPRTCPSVARPAVKTALGAQYLNRALLCNTR